MTELHSFRSKYNDPHLELSGACVDCGVTADAHDYAEFKRGEMQAVRDLMCNHDVEAIRAEATAAAEQRLRDPWRCSKCGEPLHGTDVEHGASASPRQGEPVDVERLARALGRPDGHYEGHMVVWKQGIGFLNDPMEGAEAIISALAALSEPAEAGERG